MNSNGLSVFFELTPDLVWMAGKDGFLKKANPALIKKFGYSEEELYSRPITTFMHPADIEKTLLNRFRLFDGEVLHNFSNRYITKAGDVIWLEWTSVYIAEEELVLAIAKDITARKEIEREVTEQYDKFKGLTTHFKNLVERDRKYFAYELHEELAQLVSVINMDVGWLNIHITDLPEKAKHRIEHASEVCKLIIRTIQRLAFSISPQMLDDVGLNATMEWLCNEFSVLNNISCIYENDYDENLLTHEIKIDFFRICQEALSDILNYSHAGDIKISIKDNGGQIELLIHDGGNGFSTDLEKQTTGLISIQERANSINGKVNLQSSKGGGTGISVTIDKRFTEVIA
ncbi:MAG: PAS domain S-box protein [Ferruginibacter sp.]